MERMETAKYAQVLSSVAVIILAYRLFTITSEIN